MSPSLQQLRFPPTLRASLVEHALSGDPDEVCGLLAGREGQVERVLPVRNTADAVAVDSGVFRDRESGSATAGRKAVHYFMDPRDQLRAYNQVDEAGLDVVAYYHSHTHTEAKPSPTDVRLASDLSTVYVLVGLRDRTNPSVRAWRIVKDDPMSETGTLIELPVID